MDAINKEILSLRQEIEEHNHNYYTLDNPTISDSEYDSLVSRLQFLESMNPWLQNNSSPTQKVGGSPSTQFKKITHEIPMLSLSNVFSDDEFFQFHNRTKKNLSCNQVEYAIENKIDGLSISLTYENGMLVKGSTRGDGNVGEDVTENLKTIADIPINIINSPPFLEVRGEVFMPKDAFIRLNQERTELGEPTFANPRNAAAGSLRQINSNVTKSRQLNMLIFNLEQITNKELLEINGTKNEFLTHHESLEYLTSLGFKTNKIHLVSSNIEEILALIKKLESSKTSYSHQIDGVVVKVNNLLFRNKLGNTSKNPRWAIAYKFKAEQKETILEKIEIQIGRTGVATPIACFCPVTLDGTVVSRATLHNNENILKKDIRIGDVIILQKAGDIIPEIVKPLIERRKGTEKTFEMPKTCPKCGENLVRIDSEVASKCKNMLCPAQKFRRILHFVSRNAMNIIGLGSSVTERLLEKNLIIDVADIFSLSYEKLLSIPNFKDKSIKNLLFSIEKAKENNLDKLIYALGIPLVGARTATIICKKFTTIWEIMSSQEEDLLSIHEIGKNIAKNIVQHFSLDETKKTIKKLDDLKVNLIYKTKSSNHKLSQKTFVITGTFKNFTRAHLIEKIKSFDGIVSSNISSGTNYLLCGDSPGSKYNKAIELNVPIIKGENLLEFFEQPIF